MYIMHMYMQAQTYEGILRLSNGSAITKEMEFLDFKTRPVCFYTVCSLILPIFVSALSFLKFLFSDSREIPSL